MPAEITVPRLGWSMEEAIFSAWLKHDGEMVCAGDLLFAIESDKTTQEIESIDAGVLHLPPNAPQPGEKVLVGQLIGYLLANGERAPGQESGVSGQESGAAPTHASVPPVAAPPVAHAKLDSPVSSPRARRVARELGVDWTNIAGTGRGGRIREADIRLAAAGHSLAARSVTGINPAIIAITDWTFPDLSLEEAILEQAGCRVVARQCKTEAELIALVADSDAVITQFARINSSVIAAMNKARAIVRYGIGVDNVDLDAARAHLIPVSNIPDYCIDEVADHTLAFILGLTRQVVTHTADLRAGHWRLAVPVSEMKALRDLTVGVIGFGRIGREVVRRLLPFKCRVFVHDPVVSPGTITAAGASAAALEQVLSGSDVVTLHCPSTAETRQIIGPATLAKMKRGALLINVARGDLVDTAALVSALQSGQLAAAALDVFDPEPLPSDHPLRSLPNVIIAPHIASVSPAAVKKLREGAATRAVIAARGELPPNVVNGVTSPRLFTATGQLP